MRCSSSWRRSRAIEAKSARAVVAPKYRINTILSFGDMTADQLLRRTREKAGLTQAELARKLRRSQSRISALERAGANPTIWTLEEALRATGHELELRAVKRAPNVDEGQIAQQLTMTPARRMSYHDGSRRNLAEMVRKARPVR